MNFELKSFEDKINDITEQFMSLLDSKDYSNNNDNNYTYKLDTNPTNVYTPSFEKPKNDYLSIDFSKIIPTSTFDSGSIPNHAVKFGSVVDDDLNKRLEELYQDKKVSKDYFEEKPVIKFADSNINNNVVGNIGFSDVADYTKDKIDSINEKEEKTMANFGYDGNNEEEGTLFSFATVPQERALTEKRSFADVLFMDIPWDTKIDVWGGIKSLFNTDIRFTF